MASVCGLAVPSALQPQAGLWCHLTHYHPGHELAGLTRACQALCRHGIHYQLGDLGVCLYKRMVFSWLILHLPSSNVSVPRRSVLYSG